MGVWVKQILELIQSKTYTVLVSMNLYEIKQNIFFKKKKSYLCLETEEGGPSQDTTKTSMLPN